MNEFEIRKVIMKKQVDRYDDFTKKELIDILFEKYNQEILYLHKIVPNEFSVTKALDEKIGFTVICNKCGNIIILKENGETFYEWNTISHSEDILIGNVELSNFNQIKCRCGNIVSEV